MDTIAFVLESSYPKTNVPCLRADSSTLVYIRREQPASSEQRAAAYGSCLNSIRRGD